MSFTKVSYLCTGVPSRSQTASGDSVFETAFLRASLPRGLLPQT